MNSKTIKIQGWQSWTPCKPYPNIFDFVSRHFYSPFGQTDWNISEIKRPKQIPIAGWNSYYAFGRNINEEKILANAKVLSEKIKPPMNTYIVIDDGWCNWGDWENVYTDRFPKGLKRTANEIKTLSLKPAIWMAPLLSNLPTTNRLPVFPFNYIQDIENPKVFQKIINSVEVLVEKYGFEFLKLDFLYAIHHLKKYKNAKIPDQVLKHFLTTIRRKYPHVHINLCGCPIGLGMNVCDSMRISADNIGPYLDNIWQLNKLLHSRLLNQLKNNLESRFHTNKFWLLDPDVFTCRKSTGLSEKQILKLGELIKKANGLYFLGDDLTKLSDYEINKFIKPLFISDNLDKNKSPAHPT